MQEQTIISIQEFRRLAGKEAEQYSDEQIEELIIQLDFLARLYINQQKQGEKAE